MAVVSLIEINTVQLSGDIRRLRAELDNTRSHLKQLREKMLSMNSMWEGPANQVIQERFQEDHDQMLVLCSSLEGLIRTLESIRDAYDTCENNVRGAVDALRI